MNGILKSNIVVYSIFLLLSIAIWKLSNVFFWKDDWFFLRAYLNDESGFIPGLTFVSDVKPLFKYLLNLEFSLFKENFMIYNYISLALFSTWVFTIYLLFKHLSSNNIKAFIISLIILLVPANFMNVHCIFQQTELAHLIFLSLFIYFLLLFAKTNSLYYVFSAAIAIVTAHLFFPNALFIPLAGILFIQLFIENKIKKWSGSFIMSLSYIPILIHYFILTSNFELFDESKSNSLLAAFIYAIEFVGISFLRIFLYTASSYPQLISFIIGSIVISGFFYLHIKLYDKERKLNLFFFVLLIFCTGTVAYTRAGDSVLYYYSQLHLIPLIWLLYQFYEKLIINKRPFDLIQKVCLPISVIYVGLALLQIQYSKSFFSKRNSLNQFLIEKNITEAEVTEVYDEPIASEEMKKYDDAYVTYKDEKGPKALGLLIKNFRVK